ncbi:ATP-binding cassette domain-containing protein [Dickeya dianthicola]|uniref:ATP-binding cassette domain-containing protein n=1 Tax=Dickeya dianthicola TaxID=204039 RepID=UPI003015A7C3
MPIFELRSVNKNYYLDSAKRFFSRAQKTPAVNALNNINLQIYAGEIFVIVGLSGSGKSTLLRTLNHLIPASSGAVIFQGQTLAAHQGCRADCPAPPAYRHGVPVVCAV